MGIVRHAAENPVHEARLQAGQWVTALTAAFAAVAVGLSVVSFRTAWWTSLTVTEETDTEVEVTLWSTYTTTYQQADDSMHEGCTNACDQTRTQFNKVNTYELEWAVRCDTEDDLDETCRLLGMMRWTMVAAILAGFLHLSPTILSFLGAGQRSWRKVGPMFALVMASATFISLVVTLLTSEHVDMPEALGGLGYHLAVAALAVTLFNVLLCGVGVVVSSIVAKETKEGVVVKDPLTEIRPSVQLNKHTPDPDKLELAHVLALEDKKRRATRRPTVAWGDAAAADAAGVSFAAAPSGSTSQRARRGNTQGSGAFGGDAARDPLGAAPAAGSGVGRGLEPPPGTCPSEEGLSARSATHTGREQAQVLTGALSASAGALSATMGAADLEGTQRLGEPAQPA